MIAVLEGAVGAAINTMFCLGGGDIAGFHGKGENILLLSWIPAMSSTKKIMVSRNETKEGSELPMVKKVLVVAPM